MLDRLRGCNDETFFGYYRDNMTALGLEVPDTSAGWLTHALMSGGAITWALESLGGSATTRMIAFATRPSEKFAAGTALYASFYVGASIGSIAVATGRYLGCGRTLVDALAIAQRAAPGRQGEWVQRHLKSHPEIIFESHPMRPYYHLVATGRHASRKAAS